MNTEYEHELVEISSDSLADYDEQDTVNTMPNNAHDEVLTAVILTRCPVVDYNSASGVLVYERDGRKIQTNAIEYHGEGYVEVE